MSGGKQADRRWRLRIAIGASALLLAAATCGDIEPRLTRVQEPPNEIAERPSPETPPEAPVDQFLAIPPLPLADVTGTLVRTEEDEILIREDSVGYVHRLALDEDTEVIVDGVETGIEALPEGTRVRASYDYLDDQTRVAKTVEWTPVE